jgi:EEF1A N-terminal glycine/lysine methyltransferase
MYAHHFQIAVSTVKYLVELRGWNGIALSSVHSRDAKIYADDPGVSALLLVP